MYVKRNGRVYVLYVNGKSIPLVTETKIIQEVPDLFAPIDRTNAVKCLAVTQSVLKNNFADNMCRLHFLCATSAQNACRPQPTAHIYRH